MLGLAKIWKIPYVATFQRPRPLARSVMTYKTYSTSTLPSDPRTSPLMSAVDIARKKNPTRGGQNLSSRFHRLEKSLRGKEGYDRRIADLREGGGTAAHISTFRAPEPRTFAGFVIPEKPRPPADDECCMSGCAICVYDLYEEALNDYNNVLSSIRTSLNVLHISEDEWPASIRSMHNTSQSPKKSASLSAFEELELRLRQKQESGVSPPANTSYPLSSRQSSYRDPTSMLPTTAVPSQSQLLSVTAPLGTDKALSHLDSQIIKAQPFQPVRRRRRRKTAIPNAASVYESFRWILFSNR